MGEYAVASIKTSDGQMVDFMRHHLELVINSYFFFSFVFLHKKPTRKRIDEECCCGASWVLTSIKPRDNHAHVHMAREIFKTYPFFMYTFYTYIFKYCYKKWFDIYSTRGDEGK